MFGSQELRIWPGFYLFIAPAVFDANRGPARANTTLDAAPVWLALHFTNSRSGYEMFGIEADFHRLIKLHPQDIADPHAAPAHGQCPGIEARAIADLRRPTVFRYTTARLPMPTAPPSTLPTIPSSPSRSQQ